MGQHMCSHVLVNAEEEKSPKRKPSTSGSPSARSDTSGSNGGVIAHPDGQRRSSGFLRHAFKSKGGGDGLGEGNEKVANALLLGTRLSIPARVEHFYPPTFPIDPDLSQEGLRICAETWEYIKNTPVDGRPGAIAFYETFYVRLYDRSAQFENVFNSDSAKQGAVLLLVMEFVTTLDMSDPHRMDKRILALGHVHRYKPIRPWMYSVYVDCLITTISICLGRKATYIVMNSWVQLLSYVLRRMLPPAITVGIIPSECMHNVLSEMVDANEALSYHAKTSGRNSNRNNNAQASSPGHESPTASATNATAITAAAVTAADNVPVGAATAPTTAATAVTSSAATPPAGSPSSTVPPSAAPEPKKPQRTLPGSVRTSSEADRESAHVINDLRAPATGTSRPLANSRK